MATLAEQITEAKAALHNLMIGKMPVVYVDQNGERVEYNRTSVGNLQKYIADLEAQQSGCPRGPLRMLF